MFLRMPSVLLAARPSSLSSAMSSRLRSLHVTISLVSTIGLYLVGKFVASCCMYLPKLPLIAVLPSPNRSYAAPNRGAVFFQFGRSGIAAKLRSGTKRPAPIDCPGTDPRKISKRMPGLSVSRLIVHESCTYNPMSPSRSDSESVGELQRVMESGAPFRYRWTMAPLASRQLWIQPQPYGTPASKACDPTT